MPASFIHKALMIGFALVQNWEPAIISETVKECPVRVGLVVDQGEFFDSVSCSLYKDIRHRFCIQWPVSNDVVEIVFYLFVQWLWCWEVSKTSWLWISLGYNLSHSAGCPHLNGLQAFFPGLGKQHESAPHYHICKCHQHLLTQSNKLLIYWSPFNNLKTFFIPEMEGNQ